jgi:hypothetical protein
MSARDTGGTDEVPPGVEVDTSAAPSLLRYTLSGAAPPPAAWTALRRQLVARGHLTRDTVMLVDMRRLTTLPSLANLRSIMAAAAKERVIPRAVAFLASEPTQFGVGRQAEMLMPSSVTGAVFTDEAEAVAWCSAMR